MPNNEVRCCNILTLYNHITFGGAVNRNNISDYFYFLVFFFVSYPLQVSAPKGHPQVEYTLVNPLFLLGYTIVIYIGTCFWQFRRCRSVH
jgi:hypothetical protein